MFLMLIWLMNNFFLFKINLEVNIMILIVIIEVFFEEVYFYLL